VFLCEQLAVPPVLAHAARRAGVPLLTSTEPSQHVINVLRPYMQRELGEVTTLHGVFLDVLGLGVLNIRSIFGETAVRPRKALRLIAHLEAPEAGSLARERLTTRSGTQDILGVEIPTVTLPVAPGRNLAVLVEAAVRNHILLTRGIDSTREFIARQEAAMRSDPAAARRDEGD